MDSASVLWVIAITASFVSLCGAICDERIELKTIVLGTITRRHWDFSKWLTPSALMIWTTGNFFIIAAGVLLGTAAVGALKAAQNIMGITHILFRGLENIVRARAARKFHMEGKKALRDYLKRVALLGSSATVAVAVIAAATPELWLRLVFGLEYQGYGYLLQWWAAIYVLTSLGLPLAAGLQAIEHTRSIFWGFLLATLFSVLFAFPMTEHLGLVGVMGGIAAVILIRVLTQWFGLKKMLN